MRALAALTIASGLGGCGKFPPPCDQNGLPMDPLAVGAVGDFSIEQSSSEGADCSPTEYDFLTDETIEDPTLFVIEPANYDGPGQRTRIRLRALAPGTTRLIAVGHFKFTSEETLEVEIRSEMPDRAELEPIDRGWSPCEAPVRVQTGRELLALVHLFAGTQPLSGRYLAPFEASGLVLATAFPTSQMLAEIPPIEGPEPVAWTAPEIPASGTITSNLANTAWSLAWEAFDATGVDGLTLRVDADAGAQTAVTYDLLPTIGGSVPCAYDDALVSLSTTTPQICTIIPAFVTRVSAGVCELVGTVVGGTARTTATVTFH